MGTDFAPAPITYKSTIALSVAFIRMGCDRSGAPLDPQWWNHANGGYESTFVASAHLRPLKRISDDPASPNYAWQSFGVPADALIPADMQGFVYQSTGAIDPASPIEALSRVQLEYFSGA